MTRPRPRTKKIRAAHAAWVRFYRMERAAIGICRDCGKDVDRNPATGEPFKSCPMHRKIDLKRKRKEKSK